MSRLRLIYLLSAVSLLSTFNLQAQFSNNFDFGYWYSGSKDFLEVTYGFNTIKNKDINAPFHKSSLSELKLGRRFFQPVANYRIIQFSDNYLFSSFLDDYREENSEQFKLSYDIWRFGLGYRKGYGYKVGNFGIFPFYNMGLVWNQINLNLPNPQNPIISDPELKFLNNYNDQIKFGTNNIGGLDIQLSSVITIGSAYETSVIFPYHKFWKQFGSFMIETFAQTGIDFLTEGVIVKAAPSITPIVYFLLKNGLSYYFFTLKEEEMNWPFETVAPLTMKVLRFNLKVSL